MRIAVAGALGRTGLSVVEAVLRNPDFELAGACVEADDPRCGTDLTLAGQAVALCAAPAAGCDVVVDFTAPAGTMHWLDWCVERRVPLVSGTTGLTEEQQERWQAGAAHVPLLHAANFSVGIHLLRQTIRQWAAALGEEFDVEIVETHHRHKVDAPSGTALRMLNDLLDETGRSREQVVFGRAGETGPRPRGQIGVHALRLGETVGVHEVHFSGPGETLTVKHTAHARTTFATGALRAAAWIVRQPPGKYSLSDVLDGASPAGPRTSPARP